MNPKEATAAFLRHIQAAASRHTNNTDSGRKVLYKAIVKRVKGLGNIDSNNVGEIYRACAEIAVLVSMYAKRSLNDKNARLKRTGK